SQQSKGPSEGYSYPVCTTCGRRHQGECRRAAVGFENRHPMLNKENYVPWSSRLLRYAKSRLNGKLIHNSIINGPYVRRMIPELGDTNREVPVNETFHAQTDDELNEKELKHIEADDQAIQTILLGLPEDIYAVVDSYETAQEIWLRVQQMMKGSDIGLQEKKAKLFNEWEMFTSNDGESIESYYHLPHQDHPSFNKNYMQQPMLNPKDITDPTTAMNMTLALMPKAFKLNYSTPNNNNQRISSNPRNRQIAQPGMNMGQDRQMQMVGGNGENQFRQYVGQNVGNPNGYNTVQNVRNQNGNGNLVATRAEGNATGHNDLDEIEEVNANCILMANLQQASTSGQFCDSDLEVAFRRNSSFIRNLEGVDLLKGDHSTNIYTINLYDMASASPICLMAPAYSTKSWLWHQRLSHLNFDTINDLPKMILSPVFQSSNIIRNIFFLHVSKEKAKEHLIHPNQFQILGRSYIFFIWICVVQ
nr:integrase, catalytic region, zinc finger, CCHC-type, peptidase aspartic, catalytic [Tanacetum cinerariifolium]